MMDPTLIALLGFGLYFSYTDTKKKSSLTAYC
jgi:hypothetical protein